MTYSKFQFFQSRAQRFKFFLYVVVTLVALFSFSKRTYRLDETSAFEEVMIESFAPIQKGIKYTHDRLSSFFSHYIMNVNASQENKQLMDEIKSYKNKIFRLDQVEKENKRLKKLLRFGDDIQYKKVLAQIVAWDASSDFRVIRINKGAKDGVELQSPVVTSKGLVGYILRLTDNFSDILTIVDPNNRVDGIVDRIRSHGVVEGFSGQSCLMKYVKRTEPVILNDLVITSGLGNIYPKGLRIGRVSRIERESYGITQYIEIEPSVDFSQLEEVVVLIAENNDKMKKEWKALDELSEGGRE